jgi:hypothetical protein
LHVNKPEVTRRRFLAQVAIAVPAGAALLDVVVANTASAQAAAPLPKLEMTDPSAKALLYVDNAANVDRKNPLAVRYAPGQTCSTCSQIQGVAGDAYRPCAIFPGKLVNSKGWCSVWAAKT